MLSNINIRVFKDLDASPTLILLDLQREYQSETRRLALETIGPALKGCSTLLHWARECKYPVIFTRWVQPSTIFNKNTAFSQWIEGFKPTGSDTVVEHSWPSCYSSPEFSQIMACGGGRNAIIAGLTSSMACLSTIVEGAQRHHKFSFVKDASTCHSHMSYGEAEVHEMATVMISHFATVITTSQCLDGKSPILANSGALGTRSYICG